MESEHFFLKVNKILDRIENIISDGTRCINFDDHSAFRWSKTGLVNSKLIPIRQYDRITIDDLIGITPQVDKVDRNTEQFVNDLPANNILLTGARGTGKSSLIKSVFKKHMGSNLKLIELGRDSLCDIQDVLDVVAEVRYKFIIFCDDLSFELTDQGYKALKAALDGSMLSIPKNVLIYATSNRRHLIREYFEDNLPSDQKKGEIHPSESVEESISLSERFGLWISFYPFDQSTYLAIVSYWISFFGGNVLDDTECKHEALQWALSRGSRSGRVAKQFAIAWIGKNIKIRKSEN